MAAAVLISVDGHLSRKRGVLVATDYSVIDICYDSCFMFSMLLLSRHLV
jgi:hypothetical protein